jgi:hypothetical protein
METSEAVLLLPSFASGGVEVALGVASATTARLGLRVNGRPVGETMVDPAAGPARFRIPASLLFRGDNLLTLSSQPGLRLRTLAYRPLP